MRSAGKFWIALLVLVIWMAVTVLVGLVQPHATANQAALISGEIIYSIIAASTFLVVILLFLKWDRLGFQKPQPLKSVMLTWLPLGYIVLLLGGAIATGLPPATTVAIVLINCLFVGFSEEAMFRGILFRGALARMRILPATIFTSAVFGLIHTLNVFATGQLTVAIIQSVAAFMSGMLYQAIRIRTQSVYPMMVIHALWDFSLFMVVHSAGAVNEQPEITFQSLIVPVMLVIPLLGYGIYLLRNLERDFGWMSDKASRTSD